MEVFDFGTTAFLAGSNSLVVMSDTKGIIGETNTLTEEVTPVKGKKAPIKFVRRGATNKQPVEVMEKIYDLSTLGANIAFNAKMAYGDGIMVVKKKRDESGKIVLDEQIESEQQEVFKFLSDNNYINATQEWSMDIVTFYEAYCELIFARGGNKIVQINPVESTNSRLSVASEKTGEIEYHGYSYKWHEGTPDDVTTTRLIDRRAQYATFV
jgi:hypothetical protein